MVLGCLGALDMLELADGGPSILDTNHMVAYDERSLQAPPRRRRPLDPVGEDRRGLGLQFTGPGRVYGQTRSPQSLISG